MVDDGTPFDAGAIGVTDSRDVGAGLCNRFVARLPVSGASISVVAGRGQLTIGSSDSVSARIEELQFDLGEGPHWDALHTGTPVLVPELGADQHASWPVFTAAVAQMGVGALFVFPLLLGAATVGVVDLYRNTPGLLDSDLVAVAQNLAASTAGPAVRLAAQSAIEETPDSSSVAPEMRREVHQATGMVLAQLGISATEAFARLQAHAFSIERTLEYVAHEVVARRIDFRQLPD